MYYLYLNLKRSYKWKIVSKCNEIVPVYFISVQASENIDSGSPCGQGEALCPLRPVQSGQLLHDGNDSHRRAPQRKDPFLLSLLLRHGWHDQSPQVTRAKQCGPYKGLKWINLTVSLPHVVRYPFSTSRSPSYRDNHHIKAHATHCKNISFFLCLQANSMSASVPSGAVKIHNKLQYASIYVIAPH